MNEYLHYFVAARNARASAALGELALVICRNAELINTVDGSACCCTSIELATVGQGQWWALDHFYERYELGPSEG